MAVYCTNAMIANYQVATQFAIIVTFFTIPISTVLFPAFSKIDPKKKVKLLQTVFTFSVKVHGITPCSSNNRHDGSIKTHDRHAFRRKRVYTPFFLTLYAFSTSRFQHDSCIAHFQSAFTHISSFPFTCLMALVPLHIIYLILFLTSLTGRREENSQLTCSL